MIKMITIQFVFVEVKVNFIRKKKKHSVLTGQNWINFDKPKELFSFNDQA